MEFKILLSSNPIFLLFYLLNHSQKYCYWSETILLTLRCHHALKIYEVGHLNCVCPIFWLNDPRLPLAEAYFELDLRWLYILISFRCRKCLMFVQLSWFLNPKKRDIRYLQLWQQYHFIPIWYLQYLYHNSNFVDLTPYLSRSRHCHWNLHLKFQL